MVFIITKMDLYTQVNGKMIINMDTGLKKVVMEVYIMGIYVLILEILFKEKKMVLESLHGQMDHFSRVNCIIMLLRVRESSNGLIKKYIKDNGKIIKCMEKVQCVGLTENFMKENFKMI